MYSMFKSLLEIPILVDIPLKEVSWIAIIASLINSILFYIAGLDKVVDYCDEKPILCYIIIFILIISISITLLTIIIAGYKLAYLMLFS